MKKCKQTAEKYAVLPKYGNLDIILSLDFYVKSMNGFLKAVHFQLLNLGKWQFFTHSICKK